MVIYCYGSEYLCLAKRRYLSKIFWKLRYSYIPLSKTKRSQLGGDSLCQFLEGAMVVSNCRFLNVLKCCGILNYSFGKASGSVGYKGGAVTRTVCYGGIELEKSIDLDSYHLLRTFK